MKNAYGWDVKSFLRPHDAALREVGLDPSDALNKWPHLEQVLLDPRHDYTF